MQPLKRLVLSLFVLMLALLIVGACTFAWFSYLDHVSTDPFDIQATCYDPSLESFYWSDNVEFVQSGEEASGTIKLENIVPGDCVVLKLNIINGEKSSQPFSYNIYIENFEIEYDGTTYQSSDLTGLDNPISNALNFTMYQIEEANDEIEAEKTEYRNDDYTSTDKDRFLSNDGIENLQKTHYDSQTDVNPGEQHTWLVKIYYDPTIAPLNNNIPDSSCYIGQILKVAEIRIFIKY